MKFSLRAKFKRHCLNISITCNLIKKNRYEKHKMFPILMPHVCIEYKLEQLTNFPFFFPFLGIVNDSGSSVTRP